MNIRIYDSVRGEEADECVCGGGFIKFAYSNCAGKLLVWMLLKRKVFSKFCGLWADSALSRSAVKKFVKSNGIDAEESLLPMESFKTFNEFFTRELKAQARPVCGGESTILFPADARHLGFENVSEEGFFYAKGRKFNLEKLLNSADLAKRFAGGSMIISRLSPLDYHRFHYPVSGHVCARKRVKGSLYTVSPIALSRRLGYLLENERVLTMLECEKGGLCAMLEIGATNVGTIRHFDAVGDSAVRGAQKGLFRFGGSCVITLFEKNTVKLNAALLDKTKSGLEYYARVNSAAGEFIS